MQVSIPRNIIEELKEKYGCSDDEAARAHLIAQDRASESYQESLEQNLGVPTSDKNPLEVRIYTPREIKDHLDKYVIGQEEYKKRICIAASYHFAMVRYLRDNPEQDAVSRFRKKNTLIAGPSGSGKTYCVEVLGDLLNVPALIIDSTDYTEAGYVGKSSDDMIRELIDMAPGSSRMEQARFIAENGAIIFIDEIDKKAREGGITGHDISRQGFQRSVLKLMERKLIPVDNPYSPAAQIQEAMEGARGGTVRKDKMLSTENILFILGGSFERAEDNLESIVKKRVEHGGNLQEDGSVVIRGFGDEGGTEEREKYKNYYSAAGSEDYIRFGLLPELVGRAPIRTFVNLLSKNDLMRIMTETKDSILHQYELEFRLFGIELEIEPDAVEYTALQAENKKTGARALVSVWENILTEFQFELPGSGLKNLKITSELCSRPMDALLELMKKSPILEFIEKFKNEYGIELLVDDDVIKYIEEFASDKNMEIYAAVKELLRNVQALNYMHRQGPFRITREILEDPTYFDKLFAEWYRKNQNPSKDD